MRFFVTTALRNSMVFVSCSDVEGRACIQEGARHWTICSCSTRQQRSIGTYQSPVLLIKRVASVDSIETAVASAQSKDVASARGKLLNLVGAKGSTGVLFVRNKT